MSLYADDPQVHVDYAITDERTGDPVDFVPAAVTPVDGEWVELTTAWVGDAASPRTVRVDLFGLTAGTHRLRLGNPDGNDIELGSITLY